MLGPANPLAPLCPRCGNRAAPEAELCAGCHEAEQAKITAERLDGFRFTALDWFRTGHIERLPKGCRPWRRAA